MHLSFRRLLKQSSLAAIFSIVVFGGISTSTKAATIVVPAGGDLQAAINASSCGDNVVLQAGATWDTNTPYSIPNKGCGSSNPITIRSSALSSLPSGRVGPADAVNMPRLRTSGSDGVFQTQPNASNWVFDGLEITDNASGMTVVNYFFDFGTYAPNNITVQRCYLHPKEIGTLVYNRAAMRGMNFEGSGLLFKWNHAAGFLGRQPDGQLSTTQVILCVNCNNIVVTDNFLEAWYTALFTGGGGESPEYTATLSGTVTTNQAIFSSVAGLSPGVYLRFNVEGSGTINSARSFTRSAGAVLTSNDVNHTIWITDNVTTLRAKVIGVSGNNFTLEPYNQAVPSGACTFIVFETAKVTAVSGNTVHYDPVGVNYLTQAPTAPGSAAWRVNQVVHDITVTKNTFNIDIEHARYEHATHGNNPKGWVEMKAGDTVLYEGNYFTGYPSTMGITQHSNEGFTPWTTVQNLTIRSNFVNTSYDVDGTRQWLIISLADPYATDALGSGVTITNNLVKNVTSLAQVEPIPTASITHNTIINDSPSAVYGSYILTSSSVNTGWTLRDNILVNNNYGMNCSIAPYNVAACWPSMSFQNNVIVDNFGNGDLVSRYGTGTLNPIRSDVSQVGFSNMAGNDFRLHSSSTFRNAGSDGTDPGVNWTVLVNALGFDPATTTTPGPTPTPSPTPNPTPTATPTPTPTPSPTPTPAPTPSTQFGESILRVKRDGQDLSNLIASSGGPSAPGSGSALMMTSAVEAEALQLFITQIQTAFTQFNDDPGPFPAALRIREELTTALQSALQAQISSLAGDLPGVRIHLRVAIDHLELVGVLVARPDVTNPIDVASYVVRQHYVDFFDREPETSGNDFWINEFAACGTDTRCFEEKRIHVSAAFFLSIEFQQTGYFIHRLYRSSYGRVPLVTEFMPDNAVLGRGIIVGTAGWEGRLAANKDQFLQSWVQRADFSARYGSLTNEQYVDTLIANLGVTIDLGARDKLILGLANGSTRANVLGELAQNEVFSRSEFNRAFVLMEYFGYLRRDPDTAGFNFWLNKLNQFDGNYQSADMVKAFLASQEYRERFAL